MEKPVYGEVIPLPCRPQETAPQEWPEEDIARQWLCEFLGFQENSTQIVYSDALGTGLSKHISGYYVDLSRPRAQPRRSPDFAYLIRDLFAFLNKDKKKLLPPRGFSSQFHREFVRREIRKAPDLAVLGSEISNALFRETFADTRGGGVVQMFVDPNADWFVEELPVKVGTETPDRLLRVVDGDNANGLEQHWEFRRGWTTPVLSSLQFPAQPRNMTQKSIDCDVGDFIITKLRSPLYSCPERREFFHKKFLSINGIHGKGARAAKQLFEFRERPGTMKAEVDIIETMMARIHNWGSWQAVVRASEHDGIRFTKFKLMYVAKVSTNFTLNSPLRKFVPKRV